MDINFSYTLFIMKKELKLNTITWILLVALIILSTIFSEKGLTSAYILIMVFAVIKFLAVTFQFVEVKGAHLAWKFVSVLFVAVYFIGVLSLY